MIKYEFKKNKLTKLESISCESIANFTAEIIILKMLKTKGLITQSEYDKTITLLNKENKLNIKTN